MRVNGRLLNLSLWLIHLTAQLLLVVVFYSQLTSEELIQYCYNTDYLYLPSLYQDVVVDHGNILSWRFTPSPYFFPDMLIYFVVYPLTGNVGMAGLVFAMVQLILIQYLFHRIIKLLNLNESIRGPLTFSCQLMLTLFLLFSAITKENYITHLLLSHSSHMGVLINLLVLVWLYLRVITNPAHWMNHVMFVVITILCIVSDKLIIAHALIPLILTSVWYSLVSRKFLPLIVVISSTLAGWLAVEIIDDHLFIPSSSNPPVSLYQSFTNFFQIINDLYIINKGSVVLLLLNLCTWVMYLLVFIRISVLHHKLVWLSFLLIVICSFSIPIFAGYMQHKDTLRYIIHSLVISAMILPLGWMFLIRPKKGVKSWVLLIPAMLIFATGAISFIRSPSLSTYVEFKSSYVRLMDIHHTKLKSGVADYWYTKQPYLLGSEKIRLVSIYPQSNIAYIWEANEDWFIDKSGIDPPVFNFSLNLDLSQYLGNPIDTISDGEDDIFIYRDFTFGNKVGSRFILTPL